jgi:hypothetical protein
MEMENDIVQVSVGLLVSKARESEICALQSNRSRQSIGKAARKRIKSDVLIRFEK